MASYVRDSRSAVRAHRRDSSSSSSSHTNSNRTRPRLLRSSATEPSITASNAIRGSFAGPGSPQRATDLLNRVAVYSPSPEQASTPGPVSRHTEPISICRDHREHSPSSSPGSQSVVMVDSPSGMTHINALIPANTDINQGYYFSFPSFEEWNRDKQEDMDKDSDD
ncbi:heterogeneous nuclear ribonucleoprotein g [Fusarium austroafricanum]|uniref:Heterogeneous nuclear ribonucleoprotein g n=1 Tax=Fusarium austroafricanum TaxID=2364996 RepID=A0A8H4KP91_9HYPO|nr:heterogeneous nuclear ribonucleoprotein g [Fusarium austroafricanum]